MEKSLFGIIKKTVFAVIKGIFTLGFEKIIWPLMRPVLWQLLKRGIVPLLFLELASEYEDWRSNFSKSREADAQLDKLKEKKEKEGDYTKYDMVVLDSGGKRTIFPLTDEEIEKLKINYANLRNGLFKLDESNKNKNLYNEDEIQSIKQDIVKARASIAEIQKKSFDRNPDFNDPSWAKTWSKIPGLGQFAPLTQEAIKEQLTNANRKYANVNAANRVDESYFEKKENDVEDAYNDVVEKLELPFDFNLKIPQIPQELKDYSEKYFGEDGTFINNTNNTIQKQSQIFDGNELSVRNTNNSVERSLIYSFNPW